MLTRLFCVTASVGLLTLFGAQIAFSGTLWLGNDNSGDVFHTDEIGSAIDVLSIARVTGIAFDGNFLYFSDNSGNVSRRDSNGADIGGGFSLPGIASLEDLAWDVARHRLWGIEHSPLRVHRIDPVTGVVEITYAVPDSDPDPALTPRGGLGMAYDCNRDLLYLSVCQRGCASLERGVVLVMDPHSGAITGELFRTVGFPTGGLAFDNTADVLWVGDRVEIRKITRNGAVLTSFPTPGNFVDGLEFMESCGSTPATRPSWGSIKRFYYR